VVASVRYAIRSGYVHSLQNTMLLLSSEIQSALDDKVTRGSNVYCTSSSLVRVRRVTQSQCVGGVRLSNSFTYARPSISINICSYMFSYCHRCLEKARHFAKVSPAVCAQLAVNYQVP
jgi:hypothetical protein